MWPVLKNGTLEQRRAKIYCQGCGEPPSQPVGYNHHCTVEFEQHLLVNEILKKTNRYVALLPAPVPPFWTHVFSA